MNFVGQASADTCELSPAEMQLTVKMREPSGGGGVGGGVEGAEQALLEPSSFGAKIRLAAQIGCAVGGRGCNFHRLASSIRSHTRRGEQNGGQINVDFDLNSGSGIWAKGEEGRRERTTTTTALTRANSRIHSGSEIQICNRALARARVFLVARLVPIINRLPRRRRRPASNLLDRESISSVEAHGRSAVEASYGGGALSN